MQLPFLPFDEARAVERGALQIPEVPKHLIVVSGGVIGLELAPCGVVGCQVTVVGIPHHSARRDDDS